jgi:hypothetical protein
VKHEYVGAQGRISVFFGNLSKSPLLHFRAMIDDYDHLKVQKQGTQGLFDDNEDGGCTVAVRTQAKLLLLVEVTAPFDDAPAMRVMFETEEGVLHEYPLRLPIVATCFMEPVTLEPGAFMQRWRSLEGQDRECQEVVKAPPNAPAIDEEYMKRISHIITDGLKFGWCKGCDPTPWTVSGAATFRTASKDANGNNINVGCLVRVEANPQAGAFRYVWVESCVCIVFFTFCCNESVSDSKRSFFSFLLLGQGDHENSSSTLFEGGQECCPCEHQTGMIICERCYSIEIAIMTSYGRDECKFTVMNSSDFFFHNPLSQCIRVCV